MVAQRVFGIALGYEDLIDHDHPLIALQCAAHGGTRRQPGIACDGLPVGEVSVEHFPCQDGRRLGPDAFQAHQLRDQGHRLIAGSLVRDHRVPLGLDLSELLEHQLQAIELARELAAEPRRQGGAIAGHQRMQALAPAGFARDAPVRQVGERGPNPSPAAGG